MKTASAALAARLGRGHMLAENAVLDDLKSDATVHPAKLRCEYAVNPLGIDETEPRLSWIVEAATPELRALRQSAYQIVASSSRENCDSGNGDLWDTGKVDSDRSIQIEYRGKPLVSRQSVWWKVRTWDQDGRRSNWSETATWTMGLLQSSDWTGQWIGVKGGEEVPEEFHDASWISSESAAQQPLFFRNRFDLGNENPASYGLLAAVGSSAIRVFINGDEIHSSSQKESELYISQSITELLHTGQNIVAIRVEPSSPSASIVAGVTLDMADGEIHHIRTNQTWKVSSSEKPGWEKPEFDDTDWRNATIAKELPLPESARLGERTRLPARMMRKEFQFHGASKKATVYLSGLGYHELHFNGKKVGQNVLAPALTDYDKRTLYVTHDVTEYLRDGNNAVGILLGNARFYAPRKNIPTFTRTFGLPRALMQLEVEYKDGQRATISTDNTWKSTTKGPIRANNYYDGEEFDARMEYPGWSLPQFDDGPWTDVDVIGSPAGKMSAQMNEPIRVMRELKPIKMTQPQPGIYVFDMGQNMVGWCRLQLSAPPGTRIQLRHAETLRANGMLYTDNLRSARQTDVYIAKGEGIEVYEPRFVSHGFRLVEMRGFPGTPSLAAITGRIANDALEEHVDFTSSDEVINHVYRNMLWGDRGNYQSVPTDCTQRDERQGWLGDRSAECAGESYMFDVSRFYTKWVRDIEDSMDSVGRINDVAPAYWPIYNENVVWPASFFLVTDMLWLQYGDEAVVRRHYPAMKRWVQHMQPFIQNDLMPVDVYGDWCVPPKSPTAIHSDDLATKTAAEILGTTYFYYILGLMSKFAAISGANSDRQAYDQISARMKLAFNKKYLNPTTNLYDNGTQTSSILSLAVGLAPEDRRAEIFKALVENIEVKTNGHVGTGLVGGQWLMQTLTLNGRPDVARQIASQTTYPSWGYMIRRGATTIWELWNGDTANPAMNSRNHLMLLGDFATWLYEDMAGINPDPEQPGFKSIILRPMPESGLLFVKASHDSPYGRIATSWKRDGENFRLEVSIPPNTSATLYLPAATPASVLENGKPAASAGGVRFLRSEPATAVYAIGSGDYVFTSKIAPTRLKL
ncbi:MAG: family 78 glycoside hydrolase catalytic domain [Acidobacteriaceae bacterium]